MMNKSIWSNFYDDNVCAPLNKNMYCDILIIGGGISGLSTAYHLINKGFRVVLVEAKRIGSGITGNTTGKLTYLQDYLYSKINRYHGFNKTKLYLNSQIDAINLVTNIIRKNNIDCNLEKVKSYIFDVSDDKLKLYCKFLNDIGVKLIKDKINKVYYVEDTYVFHPLKYLYKLRDICLDKDINIFENTRIESIEKKDNYYICRTNDNFIKTKYVVVASHYPYFLFPFPLYLKSYIEKSYIKAFKVSENKYISSINLSKPNISLRYYNDNNINYELYLSNSHNLAFSNNSKRNFLDLIGKHKQKPDYIWSNTDLITFDSLPFIGNISKDKQLLICTGYNTWGMTNGSLAGKIISDIILDKDNKYIKLFNPRRCSLIGKFATFPVIIFSNMYSFINSKFNKNKHWYSDNVRFETRNGKNVAIYIDEKRCEHIVYNRCPHLKCSLIFNEIEKTWECPCHSSKFDIDGKVINGPSNYNISYKE